MKVIKRVILLAQFALAMFLTPTACSSGVPQERTFELEIREGSLVQEESVLRVKQNDTVTIVVTADEHVGFHLHGYAIEKDAEPGEPATLEFTADATGSFPLTSHVEAEGDEEGEHEESEEEHIPLGRLEVLPR